MNDVSVMAIGILCAVLVIGLILALVWQRRSVQEAVIQAQLSA